MPKDFCRFAVLAAVRTAFALFTTRRCAPVISQTITAIYAAKSLTPHVMYYPVRY